jgi:hypothetical protein
MSYMVNRFSKKTPKIRYRVCKLCGANAIVNPDNTLRRHSEGHMWSMEAGHLVRLQCPGK